MSTLICNKCGGEFPEALFTVCHSKEPEGPMPIGVCDNCMGLSAVETPVEEPPVEEPPVEEPPAEEQPAQEGGEE
jgi:hypothetical protein